MYVGERNRTEIGIGLKTPDVGVWFGMSNVYLFHSLLSACNCKRLPTYI